MAIICLEGALAVGKSSTADYLRVNAGAVVVPEMNRLFRPEDPNSPNRRSFSEYVAEQPPGWYLERQAERWTMAVEAEAAGHLTVLDRDPFQPLWYQWAFGSAQPLEELVEFYRPRLLNGSLRFPDRYFLLTAPLEELRRRKEGDSSRDRRGYERQLAFIEPQKQYFRAMKHVDPKRVEVIETSAIGNSISRIQQSLSKPSPSRGTTENVTTFDSLVEWISRSMPNDNEFAESTDGGVV